MTAAQLLNGTMKLIPKTKDRWDTRVIRWEGKQVNKLFNTIKYRALIHGGTVGSGVYVLTLLFSGPGLGKVGFPNASSKLRVKCNCMAFRFYFAFADWKSAAFYGRPDRWALTPSKKNNTSNIPGMCKHLVLALYSLGKQKEIK